MPWNWQQPDWQKFTYDSNALELPERQFLLQSGAFIGACKHIGADDQETLVHLHFVCIHPFEDGNGRIGRALAEKSLAQNLGQPSLIALACTIECRRKD
jgi:Fic family protein